MQVRENRNAGSQNADLKDGSHGTDYLPFLSDLRATWQRVWESEIGTVVQNDFETVTKHYVVDYLSPANRDILVTEDGSFTQRYAYDADGKRLSVELGYADGTARGAVNAAGEYGENPQSDIAVSIGKAWYRASHLNSTLFAVEADGSVVAHMIYDPFGAPLLETYTDTNYSGLDNLNNFTGYAWDETLGLYYAQNRFYDATTHRFTQEDAIKDGGNWYAYCGNDPLNYVDMWGFKYVKLRALAERYGAEVDWEAANNFHSARAKVTLNGKTKYYTATNTDSDKAYVGTASSNAYNYRNGNTMYVDDTQFYAEFGLVHDRDTLLSSLTNSVNEYKNIFQTVATAPYNSTREAMEKVFSYNEKIECVAIKYSIDKAMIQAVLFQELRFYNVGDEIDAIVLQTYQYYQDLEDYPTLPWYMKLTRGVPTPPILARTDSSTGIGQIFAKTAIEATNSWNKKNGINSDRQYDETNWKDLRKFWIALKYDDEYNIDMVGLILAYESSKLDNPTPQNIMQAYNGTGNLAVKYGEVTNQYYNAFNQYNVEN